MPDQQQFHILCSSFLFLYFSFFLTANVRFLIVLRQYHIFHLRSVFLQKIRQDSLLNTLSHRHIHRLFRVSPYFPQTPSHQLHKHGIFIQNPAVRLLSLTRNASAVPNRSKALGTLLLVYRCLMKFLKSLDLRGFLAIVGT